MNEQVNGKIVNLLRGNGFNVDEIRFPRRLPHGEAIVEIDGRPYASFRHAKASPPRLRLASESLIGIAPATAFEQAVEAAELWSKYWPAAHGRRVVAKAVA